MEIFFEVFIVFLTGMILGDGFISGNVRWQLPSLF